MDERIKTAKKKTDDEFRGLLKEDKKLDKKRDRCQAELKRLKNKLKSK
jgi:hypothetical protein